MEELYNPKAPVIHEFKDGTRFLSNFMPAKVMLGGVTYPSVEHAYQAAKTLDMAHRNKIRSLLTAGKAKRESEFIVLRPNWDSMKVDVMKNLVKQKFQQHYYADLLLKTGKSQIIEGNHHNDIFWGVCNGVGQNWLGQILMEIRLMLNRRATQQQHATERRMGSGLIGK